MANTDRRKIVLGAVLLALGTALILGMSGEFIGLPAIASSLAALGMAAGALLVGTSDSGGRPV